YKYILLFLMLCCTIYSELEIEPLYKDVYRADFWWPLKFTIPTDTQGSLETRLEEFIVHLPTANQTIGYYLVEKNISQINVFHNTKKIFTKPIALKSIAQNNHLIGIY